MGVSLAHVLSLSLILSPLKVLRSRITIIQSYCIVPFVSFEQHQKAVRKSKKKYNIYIYIERERERERERIWHSMDWPPQQNKQNMYALPRKHIRMCFSYNKQG
jgi:hypothetical protein